MKTLVLGASGATGKLLVEQLLNLKQDVKVIVRPTSKIPDNWKNNEKVSIIIAEISDITIDEMAAHIKDCQAIACCLGHNLNLKGIFGKPRRLVADAVELTCSAIKKYNPSEPFRFVLMNTTGNKNRDLNEAESFLQKLVMCLLRLLVPPQVDNEKAADFLRLNIGQKNVLMEWVVVRPDTLINQDEVSEYELFASPIRSAVFNPGKTSRFNVGHFMAKLLNDKNLWEQWKGQMPAIYYKSNSSK